MSIPNQGQYHSVPGQVLSTYKIAKGTAMYLVPSLENLSSRNFLYPHLNKSWTQILIILYAWIVAYVSLPFLLIAWIHLLLSLSVTTCTCIGDIIHTTNIQWLKYVEFTQPKRVFRPANWNNVIVWLLIHDIILLVDLLPRYHCLILGGSSPSNSINYGICFSKIYAWLLD